MEVDGAKLKLLYRPLGLLFSVLGGMAAGALFNRLWKHFFHEEEVPQAKQAKRGWREILPAAALQGAVFGTVRAVVERGGLKGFEKLTGVWAGD